MRRKPFKSDQAKQRWRLYHAMIHLGVRVYWKEELPVAYTKDGKPIHRIITAVRRALAYSEARRLQTGEIVLLPKAHVWFQNHHVRTDFPLGYTGNLGKVMPVERVGTQQRGTTSRANRGIKELSEYQQQPKVAKSARTEFLEGFCAAWNGRPPKPIENPYYTGYRIALDIIRGYHEPLARPITAPKITAAEASRLVLLLPAEQNRSSDTPETTGAGGHEGHPGGHGAQDQAVDRDRGRGPGADPVDPGFVD